MSLESTEQKAERQARLSRAMGAMFLQDKADKMVRHGYQHGGSSRGVRKTHSASDRVAASTSRLPSRPMPRASTGPGFLPVQPRKTAGVCVKVVDASVLIFALRALHNWEKDGTCVVVPLEAINTLDLLKKGEEPINLAARKATRWLEERMSGASFSDLLAHPRAGVFAQQPLQTTSLTQLGKRRLQCCPESDDATDSFAPKHAVRHIFELLSVCLHCQEAVGTVCDYTVSVAYAPTSLQHQLLDADLPASLTYAPRIDGRTTEAWLNAYQLPTEVAQTSQSWFGDRPTEFGTMSVLKARPRDPLMSPFDPAPDPPMTMSPRSKPDHHAKAASQPLHLHPAPPTRTKTAAEKMEEYLKRLEA